MKEFVIFVLLSLLQLIWPQVFFALPLLFILVLRFDTGALWFALVGGIVADSALARPFGISPVLYLALALLFSEYAVRFANPRHILTIVPMLLAADALLLLPSVRVSGTFLALFAANAAIGFLILALALKHYDAEFKDTLF